MYNIQSIVMEYTWIVLVIDPNHKSENLEVAACGQPCRLEGKVGFSLQVQLLSERKREMAL